MRLVFAAMLLVGCARPNPPFSFVIDSAFSPHMRNLGLDAMDVWCEHTNADHCPNIDGDEWRAIDGVPPLSQCQHYLGCAGLESHHIWITPNRLAPFDGKTPEQIETVNRAEWLHELGHAIGLGHVNLGVMSAHEAHTELSPDDIAECRKVGACP